MKLMVTMTVPALAAPLDALGVRKGSSMILPRPYRAPPGYIKTCRAISHIALSPLKAS
jgi:hypothetical protein